MGPKPKPVKDKEIEISDISVEESIESEKVEKSSLEALVCKLAEGMAEMQCSISQLADTVAKNIKTNKMVTDYKDSGGPSTGVRCENRHYISLWRDMGGQNLVFLPNGQLHPRMYLKKIKKLFDEAGVPEDRKLGLTVNSLRGSAADWAATREDSWTNFKEFEKEFKERYWGIEQERELFYELKYGKYRSGDRAEYFLKLAAQASFLSEKLPEDKLVEWLAKHFSSDICRGIYTKGLKKIDEVEEYLRKLDGTYSSNNRNRDTYEGRNEVRRENRDERNRGVNSRQNYNNANSEPNRERNNAREGENNSNSERTIRFLDVRDELLSDDEDLDELDGNKLLSPVINSYVGGQEVDILIDSGSQCTAVSENFFRKLQGEKINIPVLPLTSLTISVAVGGKKQRVNQQVLLPVSIGGQEFDISCIVVPNLNKEILLGCDWLITERVKMDFEKMILRVDRRDLNIKIKFEKRLQGRLSVNYVTSQADNCVNKKHSYSEFDLVQTVSKAEMFNEEQRDKLLSLLKNYQDVFSDTPGRTKMYEHEIHMRDVTPFYKPSYPIAFAHREEARRQIRDMVDLGIISRAQTEYISPLTTVTKKDKSIRVCLDARHLNKKMMMDYTRPPLPVDLLLKFKGRQYLSTLDLTSSYWQVPIRERDRKYTGFLFENNTYVFNVLPFGLSTSVASFVKALDQILGPETQDFSFSYVDDLLVFSENADDHFRHLEIIFSKFRTSNITVKLRKSTFARAEVSFLGHIISPKGIRMDPNRINAIQNFPPPRNIKELRSFLGMINYDRRFVNNFSDLTVPLLRLLKKNTRYIWGVEEKSAFEEIKECFLKVSMVSHPQFDKTFYIQTDSSNYGLGCCLYQLDISGNKKIVGYASRTLQGPELRYTVTEKEMLSVVYALQQWRVIVLGFPLVIITDHKALTYLMNCPLKSPRLTRWVLYLQEFNFMIEHCRGKDNILADCLSRYPVNNKCKIKPDNTSEIEIDMISLSKEFVNVREALSTIQTDQENEPWIRLQRMTIINENGDENQWYKLYKNILFRKGDQNSRGYKLCVPKSQVKELIQQQHADIGHFGYKKTFGHMKNSFYWPKMRKHIRQVVSSCDLCQKTKVSKGMKGPYNSVVCNKPGDLLCMDFMGPLPSSRAGATQLLVIIDSFSRYTKLFAVRQATAKTVVNKLNTYIDQVLKPSAILTDNATQFHAKIYQDFLNQRNIKIIHTSVYFPQGNATERVNKEIGRLLRAFCFHKHTRWAYVLSDVEHCINNITHEVSGFTPEFLLFGSRTANNIEKVVKFPVPEGTIEQPLSEYWRVAYDRMISKAERKKQKIDSKNNPVHLVPGELVLIKTHPLSCAATAEIKKFFLLYDGPYTVKQRVGPNSYLLSESSGSIIGPHNIVNLKKYKVIPDALN